MVQEEDTATLQESLPRFGCLTLLWIFIFLIISFQELDTRFGKRMVEICPVTKKYTVNRLLTKKKQSPSFHQNKTVPVYMLQLGPSGLFKGQKVEVSLEEYDRIAMGDQVEVKFIIGKITRYQFFQELTPVSPKPGPLPAKASPPSNRGLEKKRSGQL